MRRFTLVAAVCLFAAAGACTASIGDTCTTNVDCSRLGDRFCDTSAIDGYCTVDGCNDDTCPDNAVCIRFLVANRSKPCVIGALPGDASGGCSVDERCVCDTTSNNVCLGNVAHCAPEASERRFCEKPCSQDGDCRLGYECRSTGTNGADVVPSVDATTDMIPPPAKFCAPL